MSFEGKEPLIGDGVFVAPGAFVLGEVQIGKDSSVFFNSVVRGDVNSIVIGSETNVQDNCMLHVSSAYSLEVGNGVTIGHNAVVHGCSVGIGLLAAGIVCQQVHAEAHRFDGMPAARMRDVPVTA